MFVAPWSLKCNSQKIHIWGSGVFEKYSLNIIILRVLKNTRLVLWDLRKYFSMNPSIRNIFWRTTYRDKWSPTNIFKTPSWRCGSLKNQIKAMEFLKKSSILVIKRLSEGFLYMLILLEMFCSYKNFWMSIINLDLSKVLFHRRCFRGLPELENFLVDFHILQTLLRPSVSRIFSVGLISIRDFLEVFYTMKTF